MKAKYLNWRSARALKKYGFGSDEHIKQLLRLLDHLVAKEARGIVEIDRSELIEQCMRKRAELEGVPPARLGAMWYADWSELELRKELDWINKQLGK